MAFRSDADTDRATYAAASAPGNPPIPASGMTILMHALLAADRNDFQTLVRLHAASGSSTVLNCAMNNNGTAPGIFTVGGTSTWPTADLVVGTYKPLGFTALATTGGVHYPDGVGGVTTVTGAIGGGAAGQPTGLTVAGRSVSDSTEWLNGRVAWLRIFSAVLSAAEMLAEWASATPVRTSGLWAGYQFPGTAGNPAGLTDAVGGHDLVAGSTAALFEDDPVLAAPARTDRMLVVF